MNALDAICEIPMPFRQVAHDCWRDGRRFDGERTIAEETAVELTYDRLAHAVMMATPDLPTQS